MSRSFTLLSARVSEWHRAKFGPLGTPQRIASKLVEEANELNDEPLNADEAADVMIALLAWADRAGVDVVAAAHGKLTRIWDRTSEECIQRDRERGIGVEG